MTKDLAAADDHEVEWWHEAEEGSTETTAPPRGTQSYTADDVAWAEDQQHPDYRHLDAGFAEEEFELTAADLELVIRENRFEPTREEERILFGLRGATLATGSSASGASLRLRQTRPDHRQFRCVIGVYNTATKQLSGFVGSTVPWYAYVHDYFLRGRGDPKTNMLPTGCYPYFVGPHGKHQIPGCLRLGAGHDKEQQERVAVLRTIYDVRYDTTDVFDPSIPHDNLHPSFGARVFRSRGCQTVRGTFDAGHTGEWAEFRAAAGLSNRGDNGKRFDYVLVTGLEAAIASKLRSSGLVGNAGAVLERMTRLRHGSRGELVSNLQRKLGLQPNGMFGAQETKALATLQRKKFSFADGIFSPDMDNRLEFGVFKAASIATPAQVRHIATGSKRIALVIGNGQYASASVLGNPTRDADAIAEKLKALDFSVTQLRDATEQAMVQAIVSFKDDLTAAQVGLIFYAGHGVQIDGDNYVLPIDCNPASMPQLRQSSIGLNALLEPLEESGKVGIIILDCCRDNPFRTQAVSRSLRRGFANIGAPAGTFIAFSTQPGATASDGDEGQHSPFATSLLKFIEADDEDIGQMMRQVRKEVNAKTEGRQLPWDQSSLMVDHFAFKQTNRNVEQRVLTREELDKQRREGSREREEEYWSLTSTSNSEQLLESFIAQYPDSRYRSAADAKLKEIRDARERERQKAIRTKWWSRGATLAAIILGGVVWGLWSGLQYVENNNRVLSDWKSRAFKGQFKLILAKARDKLEGENPDEARAQALAIRRIFKEQKRATDIEIELDDKLPVKSGDLELAVDFVNVVIESMKRQADVELARSLATKPVKATFTPDGRLIAWVEDGKDKLFNISDAQSGNLLSEQRRYAENIQSLIMSPDGSLAALLAVRGDAELFSLRGGTPDYYDVYIEDDVRAIAFGTAGSRPMLAAVDKRGDVLGWRIEPQGWLEGPAIRLRRAGGQPTWNSAMGAGFAISCYENLCVWIEPDGTAFAARLGTQKGSGWQRLQGSVKLEQWPGPTAPLLRLTKEHVVTHSSGLMWLYALSTKDDTLKLDKLRTWTDQKMASIDVDEQQRLTLRYPPDDKNKSWTVQFSELAKRNNQFELKHIYYRDHDKEILDFNSATRGVIFSVETQPERRVLKRRVDTVHHKEHDCVRDCDLVKWLGAKDRTVFGVQDGWVVQVTAPDELDAESKSSVSNKKFQNEVTAWFRRQTRTQQSQTSDVVDFVAYAFDPGHKQIIALLVAPDSAIERNDLRTGTFVALLDPDTGELKADPVRVDAADALEDGPYPYADFILEGESRPRDTGARDLLAPKVVLRVLVRVNMDGSIVARHDPNRERWHEARTGREAGWLYRIQSENLLRVAYFHEGPSSAGKRTEIRIASDLVSDKGGLTDFGFLDQGKSAFVAYEDGKVEIWSLDLASKEPQPLVINTRTKLKSPQNLAWSPYDRVLHVYDETTIKSFNRLGLLLDRYAPGKAIGALRPLGDGGVFAVVGLRHVNMPPVTFMAELAKMPYVAEALTPRWLASSDREFLANWFLPDEPAKSTAPPSACLGDPETGYVEECARLHHHFLTPGLKALAVSEHAFRELEKQAPGRGVAFALADAAAGKPLALALLAREIGEGDRRATGATGGALSPVGCETGRTKAMLQLYAQAMRKGRFVAPYFVSLALHCSSVADGLGDLVEELKELGNNGDPMAFALLGYELERRAREDVQRQQAVEYYGTAGRLLLALRDQRQNQKGARGQDLIDGLETAISTRRADLARRLLRADLVTAFENVENRLSEVRKKAAEPQPENDALKGYTRPQMIAALGSTSNLSATIGNGVKLLDETTEKRVTDTVWGLAVRGYYDLVRQSAAKPGSPSGGTRAALLEFMGAAQHLRQGLFAKAVVDFERKLEEGKVDDKKREEVLPTNKLGELAKHFGNDFRVEADKKLFAERANLYLEFSQAAEPLDVTLAGRLAIAGLEIGERMTRSAGNARILDRAHTRVLQLLEKGGSYDRELAMVEWRYVYWASDFLSRRMVVDAKDAFQMFENGLRLHERYVELHKATRDYARLQQRLPEAYKMQGRLASYIGNHDLAVSAYTKSLEISRRDREGLLGRGSAQEAKGANDLAIADFSEAIKISPRWDEGYRRRAATYRTMGKYKDALDDMNKVVELRPEYDEGYRFRGITLILLGEFDRAVADFTKAISIDRNDDNYFHGRAWAHFKAGRLEEALKDAELAIAINRFNPAEATDTLGHILAALGRTEDANRAFAKARERKPSLKLTVGDTLKRLAP